MQIDWSKYKVSIAGLVLWVHALVAVLGYSRKAFVRFFFDERQPTLLEGLIAAFEAFKGVTIRVVFDNMATVVLGRIGKNRTPIWNPKFVEFAEYYAFEPFLCRVRDPNRKGIVEAFIHYLEWDFVRGSEFDSLEHMNQAVQTWLDTVANKRKHGTTRRVPDEVWEQERDFFVRLPDRPFAGACAEEMRRVGIDAPVSIAGTLFTVPAHLARKTVCVRLYSERFEVLDTEGRVALARRYAVGEEKGRLHIDPDHYLDLPRNPETLQGVTRQLEEALLTRFPTLADLLVGVKQHMTGLSHVHYRKLLRLAAEYGDDAFLAAATIAQSHSRFNANSVMPILEKHFPIPPEESIHLLGTPSRAEHLLTDVDSGSLDAYGELDRARPSDDDDSDGEGVPVHAS